MGDFWVREGRNAAACVFLVAEKAYPSPSAVVTSRTHCSNRCYAVIFIFPVDTYIVTSSWRLRHDIVANPHREQNSSSAPRNIIGIKQKIQGHPFSNRRPRAKGSHLSTGYESAISMDCDMSACSCDVDEGSQPCAKKMRAGWEYSFL